VGYADQVEAYEKMQADAQSYRRLMNERKTMSEEVKETGPQDLWAIVEVMGHSQYAGRLSEYGELGVPLVRVEVPETSS